MMKTSKEEYYLSVITEAYFALGNSRSPLSTKSQQKKQLARCRELLASVVFENGNKNKGWVVDTSHIGA